MSSNKVLAIDIETTGLNPWRDQISMAGIWDGQHYTCRRSAQDLQDVLNTTYYKHELVGHNVAFDIKFLQVQDWFKPSNEDIIHDTKILAHLVKDKVPQEFILRYEAMRKEENKKLPQGVSHREANGLSLKVLAPWYLKVPPFWETPGNHDNEEYNRKDCEYTYQLYQILSERVKQEGNWDFYLRMLEWSKMIMEMEIKGISLSMTELDKLEHEYTAKRADLKAKLDFLWRDAHARYRENQQLELLQTYEAMARKQIDKGRDAVKTQNKYLALYNKALSKIDLQLNYASPAQMSWLLKEHLGLDIADPEGEESTGKAVLNRLAAEGRKDIQTFLDWREADKVLTMYIPTYKELHVDSIIHPSFNLTGTRTGRTSSSNPNLQQVPPKLYRLFKPRDGYKFIQYDLSGIEAALIALYSGDRRLYEILDNGESIHDHNAKALFGLECDVNQVSSLYPKERKTVKNIGFACFYGAGWRRISQVFAAGGFPISDAQAKENLKKLKSYYPEAFEFHREITEIFETGETVTNLLGRPINLQPHENPYMQGFNTLIQSSASDLNLLACERFYQEMKANKLDAYPLLVIHDCIMVESRDYDAELCSEHLQYHMTNFKLESINGPIKLKVEGGVSDAWEK